MKKLKNIIFSMLPMVGGFAIQIITVLLGSIITAVVVGFISGAQGVTDSAVIVEKYTEAITAGPVLYFISLTGVGLTAIVFPIIYYCITKKDVKPDYKEVLSIKNVIFLIVCGLLIQISVSSILSVILSCSETLAENYAKLMETLNSDTSIWLTMLLTVVFAPIAEECIFRGLSLRYAKKYAPFWVANIIQSLFFGIYHMNIIQGVYAFVFGIIFGYIANKLNSILPVIFLHMVINGSSLFTDKILPENNIIMIIIGIVGSGLIVGVCYLIKSVNIPTSIEINSES